MNAAMRRQRLREILAGGRCVHPASVFDPLSTRIASAEVLKATTRERAFRRWTAEFMGQR
jgi:hypothetical protein